MIQPVKVGRRVALLPDDVRVLGNFEREALRLNVSLESVLLGGSVGELDEEVDGRSVRLRESAVS